MEGDFDRLDASGRPFGHRKLGLPGTQLRRHLTDDRYVVSGIEILEDESTGGWEHSSKSTS